MEENTDSLDTLQAENTPTVESETPDTPVLLPPGAFVDRVRPKRKPLISRAVAGTLLGAFALMALILAAATYYVSGIGFEVPDVIGLQEGVARARLAQAGLHASTVERRFDPSAEGTVLSQSPPSGTRLPRGGGVGLVVSAGTEEFLMPDVIGMGINVARAQLEQAGLVVKIEAVDSDQPVDTVLDTIPAAGSAVRTSDIVRVRIAADGGVSEALLPFAFQGMTFVIDPAPLKGADVDPPLEVTRRLRSLLEASGATVVVTRSVTETDTPIAQRAQRAAEATEAVVALVGLEVVSDTPAGVAVLTPDVATFPAAQVTASDGLADALIEMLGGQGTPTTRAQAGSDPVMSATSAPAVRVRLGALASREDIAAFRDPAWSDMIARAIYRALGERYAPQ